jgi:hypothetical protein
MATLEQAHVIPTKAELTAAEDALCDIFFENLESLTPEKRDVVLLDLRANAAAHGE